MIKLTIEATYSDDFSHLSHRKKDVNPVSKATVTNDADTPIAIKLTPLITRLIQNASSVTGNIIINPG
jgi:hypothetical protein